MRLGTIAFLLGILSFQLLQTLPSIGWLWLLPMAIALYLLGQRYTWLMVYLIAGWLWCWLHAWVILDSDLPDALEREDLVVEGVIDSLPDQDSRRIRFRFNVEQAQFQGQPADIPQKILLSWYRYGESLPQVGERWRFTVRLKKPHGFMNPGGFDYERWLFMHGVRATGYIRDSERWQQGRPIRLSHAPPSINRARSYYREIIAEALKDHPYQGVVTALAIGDRSGIPDKQWELLIDSATNHLMAISGLHIGLIAGLVFWLVRAVWGRVPLLPLSIPAQIAAAIAAMIAALVYAGLAGFSVPTQRALIMVGVTMLMLVFKREWLASHVLASAALLVLIWDPLAILSVGFWLSFLAVAVILYAISNRVGRQRWWVSWGWIQLAIALGLMPVLLYFFYQFSLIGPFANIIAVPVVSLWVVPLTLMGTLVAPIFSWLGEWLLLLSAESLSILFLMIEQIVVPGSVWQHHRVPIWSLLLAVIGIMWMLMPRGWPARWLGGVLLLPVLISSPDSPGWGTARLTLLDVGQGLAVVIQTENHLLLYDTGFGYPDQFNSGDAVIVPFLRHQGVSKIDMLVLSHGDRDHIGGTAALVARFPVEAIIAGQPERGDIDSTPCHAGESWQWDGVQFQFIYPDQQDRTAGHSSNDISCVLLVEAGGKRLLLTGDIEQQAESRLISRYGKALDVDLLVAPHHGSLTSSSRPFIAATQPRYVIFSAGYKNRYGFPKQEVVDRYQEQGVHTIDSYRSGAVTFILSSDVLLQPDLYREQHRRYWHH